MISSLALLLSFITGIIISSVKRMALVTKKMTAEEARQRNKDRRMKKRMKRRKRKRRRRKRKRRKRRRRKRKRRKRRRS